MFTDYKVGSPAIFLLITILFLLFPLSVSANPLRLWVMPNSQSLDSFEFNPEETEKLIGGLAEHYRIIIENNERDLNRFNGLVQGQTLSIYLLKNNYILEELKKFQTSHPSGPEIAVEFLRWENAFNRLLSATSLPTSEMPDVVQIGSTWIPFFAKEGALANLEKQFDWGTFFTASVASAHPLGMNGIYAVPWFIDTRLLFYWKDRISQETLKSWTQLQKDCRQEKKFLAFPLDETTNILHNLAPILWAFGGDILEPKTIGHLLPAHKILLDNPKSFKAMETLRDLSGNGCVVFEDSYSGLETKFLEGKFAAILTGPWFLANAQKQGKGRIEIALPPEGPAGVYPFIGGSHLAIWNKAKERGNFDSATALISFLTSPDLQKHFAKNTGFLPVNKKALTSMSTDPFVKTYLSAVEKGRSYPPIAEWGDVVENEFVRQNLVHIWTAIAEAKSTPLLEGIVNTAAQGLRKKMAAIFWSRVQLPFFMFLSIFLTSTGILFFRFYRKHHTLEMEFQKMHKDLLNITTEKLVLQSSCLILERKKEEQSGTLDSLHKKLAELDARHKTLSKKLAAVYSKYKDYSEPLLGHFEIKYDGGFFLDGSEIFFENSGQAHSLIEHAVRQAMAGIATVNCIWGYPLFGWKTDELVSMPNRLFNTAVSKTNAPLAAKGKPMLFKSEGRKTWRWRCLWNLDLLLKNSDIYKAEKIISTAKQEYSGNTDKILVAAEQALQKDPKNINALCILAAQSTPVKNNFKKLLSSSSDKIRRDLSKMEKGLREAESFLNHGHCTMEYAEIISMEIIAMKCHTDRLKKCIHELSESRPEMTGMLYFSDVMMRLSSVQEDIARLKAGGMPEKEIWAHVVYSENFLGLVSVPQVQSLINRFYNHDVKVFEDPRLVQLALVLMLSNPKYTANLEEVKTDDEFFAGLGKELRRQFTNLEKQISSF